MPWGWGWRRNWGGGGGGRYKKKDKKKAKPKGRSRGGWQMPSSMRSMGNYMYNNRDHLDILGISDLATPSFNYLDDEEDLDTGDFTNDDGAGDVNVGSLSGSIVGIRYYRGTVNNGEMVNLVREPNNAYDPNAVKVVNVDGIQVGHIKREMAHTLAYLMDKSLVRIEGVVPIGSGSTATMPVELTFWAAPVNKQTVVDKLRYSGYYLKDAPGPSSSATGTSATGYAPMRTHLTDAQMKSELDKLFESLDEKEKTKMMEPCAAISTKLFPHQKQALNWMIQRENSYKLPPFWEERTKGQYFNTLTVFTSTRKPVAVRGGILADDMGLGKTLEMISLIMTNFVDKKPLAEPVPGKIRPSRLAKQERRRMYRKLGQQAPAATRSTNKRVKLKHPSTSQSENEAPKKPGYETECPLPELLDEEDEDLSETLSESSDSSDCEETAATMMKDDDPNFSPDVAFEKVTKTKNVPSPNILHRPRRSVTVKSKYVISSDSESDLEELPIITPKTEASEAKTDTGTKTGKMPAPSTKTGTGPAYVDEPFVGGEDINSSKSSASSDSDDVQCTGETIEDAVYMGSNRSDDDLVYIAPDVAQEVPVTTTTSSQEPVLQGNVSGFRRPAPQNVRNLNLPSASFQVPRWSLNNPVSSQIPSHSAPLLQIMPPLDPSQVDSSQVTGVSNNQDIVPRQALHIQNGLVPEINNSVTTFVNVGGLSMAVNVSVKVVKNPNEETAASKKDIADQVVQHAKEAAESICRSVLMDYAAEDHPDGATGEPATTGTTLLIDVADKPTDVDGVATTPMECPGTPPPYGDVQVVSGVCFGRPVTPEKAEAGRPRSMPSPNVKSRPRRSSKKPTRYVSESSATDGEDGDEEYTCGKKKAVKRKPPPKGTTKAPAKKRQKSGVAQSVPTPAVPMPSASTAAQTIPMSTNPPVASDLPNLTAAQPQTVPVSTLPVPNTTTAASNVPLQSSYKSAQADATNPNLAKPNVTSQHPNAASSNSHQSNPTSSQAGVTLAKMHADPDWLTKHIQIKTEEMMKAELETKKTQSPARAPSVKLSYTPKTSDPPLPAMPGFAMKTPPKCEQNNNDAFSDDDDLPDLDLLAAVEMKPAATKVKGKGKAKKKTRNTTPSKLAFCRNSDVLPDLDDVTDNPSGTDDIPDQIGSIADFDPVQSCGAMTGRTATDKPRGTLIICPLSVISNWVDQFDDHLQENYHIALYTYYGANRIRNANLLAKYDVVITTYSTLSSDLKSKNNPLGKVRWLRLVLDEGHVIRNPNAQQTKAVLELKAERKWVLTGTPIQNSMKDFYSLVNFLQISPLNDRQWWLRTIERPLGSGSETALKRVQLLMASIAMRRTKTQKVDGKPLVTLPKKDVFIEHVKLSEEERKMYDTMHKEGKLIVSKYFRAGTLLRHYGQVLAILCRLRQLCCHPFLLKKAVSMLNLDATLSAATQAQVGNLTDDVRKQLIDTLLSVLTSGSDEECSVCLDTLKNAVITPCAHVYCRTCIEAVITNEGANAVCPLCRANISRDKLVDVPPEGSLDTFDDDVGTGDWHSSTKVDALMKALIDIRAQDPTIKSMVVSQFTTFLSVIETPLTANGFKFVRFDGAMTQKQRTAAIEVFSDNFPDSPTIFLMSMKAGGVGVNLTAASRVFMMDPAWNPAAEDQCYDRCHRLGQVRDVVVTRFVVEDSVEERMIDLQEKKRSLMAGAFGKKPTADERRRARIADIQNLMGL